MSTQMTANQENDSIEYKSSWRDEWLKWICGFANAHGGILYLGIDDQGKVTGVDNPHKLLEDIPNKIVSGLGIAPAIRASESAQGTIIEIMVEPQAFPVSFKGQYYMRVGATNQLLKGTALDTFLLRKQGQSWDNAPVPHMEPGDLDLSAIERFAKNAKGLGRIPDDARLKDPTKLLAHLHLTRNGHLTNAAALLFSRNPEAYVPGSTIKIGFFEGSEILYQDVVEGPVIDQPEKAIDIIYAKYLKAQIGYEGIRRSERYPFPEAAIREAVVNAIIHKDYQSAAPVQIRISSDTLEISNPCVLPEGWTLDNLLGWHESDPHNPRMANVFFLAGYVESWGRGVQKIFASCKIDGIEPPEYQLSGNALKICFRAPADRLVQQLQSHAPSDGSPTQKKTKTFAAREQYSEMQNGDSGTSAAAEKDTREIRNSHRSQPTPRAQLKSETQAQRIIEMIAADPHITQTAMAEQLGCARSTVALALKKLQEEGLIERIGSRKMGQWHIRQNP